jgi:hypothetical protein
MLSGVEVYLDTTEHAADGKQQDEEGSEEVNGKRGASSAPQVLFWRKSKMSKKYGPWCEALGSGQGPSFPPTLTFRDFSLFVNVGQHG